MSDPNRITLKGVRLSFPDIFAPKAIEGGKPRYSANLLIPKGDKEQLGAVNKILKRIIDEEYAGKSLPGEKMPIHDGDEKEYDGYAGNYYISAANPKRPTVVDRNKSPLTAEDGKPYAGCYVNAVIRFYPLNGKSEKKPNGYGKRLCASLEVIQFVKDGEPFGASKVDLDEVLPDLDDDNDDL